MIGGWIRLRFRLDYGCLEMGKWMAFMRVGELVAKLGQYGWMAWIRLNGGLGISLGLLEFEGFIYQINLFNKWDFGIRQENRIN